MTLSSCYYVTYQLSLTIMSYSIEPSYNELWKSIGNFVYFLYLITVDCIHRHLETVDHGLDLFHNCLSKNSRKAKTLSVPQDLGGNSLLTFDLALRSAVEEPGSSTVDFSCSSKEAIIVL